MKAWISVSSCKGGVSVKPRVEPQNVFYCFHIEVGESDVHCLRPMKTNNRIAFEIVFRVYDADNVSEIKYVTKGT